MNLIALEVENFRKFQVRHRISAFGPRLNVLCGPNEFGKSTLLAALSAVLFQRHGSRTAAIRALQTFGSDTAPQVALTFAIAGAEWRIEKRFLARPYARLIGPGGHRFDDDAAETRLRDLLGVEAGGKPEHIGLWHALWVAQGGSFAQADLEAGLARSTLTSCLEAELGGIAGFGRGDKLLRMVEGELALLSDPNGRPKGARRSLGMELHEKRAEIADLESRRARLSADLTTLTACEQRRARLRGDFGAGRERAEILKSREDLARADRLAAELDAASTKWSAARDAALRAQADVEDRLAWRADIEKLEGEAIALTTRSREATDIAEHATRMTNAARTGLEAAEADLRAADETLSAARREAAGGEDRARLAERSARLGRARETETAIASAEGVLASMTMDGVRLEALRLVARACATSRDKLDAQATSIEIVPEGAPAIGVSVGGRSVRTDAGRISLVEDARVAIEGVGVIWIRPAIQDRDKTLRRLFDDERRLAGLLGEAGVATMAAAEESCATRERVVVSLNELRQVLARLVPGDEAARLEPGVPALAADVEMLRQRIAAAGDVALDQEALAMRLQDAEARRGLAADRLLLMRAEANTTADITVERREEAAAARSAAEAAMRHANESSAALRDAEGAQPRTLLEAFADQASADERTAAMRVADVQAQGDTPDSASLKARIARLEEALANRETEGRTLGEQIASLRARIDADGGAGIDERLAAAERERDVLVLRLGALDREAEALSRLADTLRATVNEARAATMLPLTRRIAPKLAVLLPGAVIECDDDFRVSTVARGSGRSEPFENLSDGTREQIAILARLAYAEMLTDRERPAMVVLDDALAFSDETRIEQMFDILSAAAARVQILVLTCRADLFGRLGGNRLSLERLDQ